MISAAINGSGRLAPQLDHPARRLPPSEGYGGEHVRTVARHMRRDS
jgi:hypothetical protein